MIFELYLSGKSMSEIVRILNEKGFKNTKGTPFLISSMRRILTNRRYTGVLLYKGEDVGARIPAIIDQETFDAVQLQIEKNKKAPARNRDLEDQYLLTGKLYCGHCKGPMSGACGISHTERRYHYYVRTARYKHSKCQKKYISKQTLESAVVEIVKRVLLQNNLHELSQAVVHCCKSTRDNGTLNRLNGELRQVNRSIENLLDMIEAGHSSSVTDACTQENSRKRNWKQPSQRKRRCIASRLRTRWNFSFPTTSTAISKARNTTAIW